MKKLFISLFSIMLILAGGLFTTDLFSAKAEEIYFDVNDGKTLVQVLSNNAVYESEDNVIRLTAPIDMTDVDLTPITDLNKTFIGIFDGNGYTISNISFSSNSQYFGIVPKSLGATFQNIKISGTIDYTFSSTNTKEIYAGVLVGYAEDTIFKNCEFESAEQNEINLPIYSDFNFGMLAGKSKGNPIANSAGNRANIRDCANYYNINLQLNKQTNVYAGGLVGSLQNGFVLNVINNGNFKFVNSIVNGGSSENTNAQYVGGIAGTISGSGTQIRNTIYGGKVDVTTAIDNLTFLKGALFASAVDTSVSTSNINFNYYTNENLDLCGDEYLEESQTLRRVEVVNDAFLKNIENFDQQSQNKPFDFASTWSLYDSKYHLQNFLTFNYAFNTSLSPYISNAKFFISKDKWADTFTSRYNLPVTIGLNLKPEYVGYFKLSKIILTDNPLFNNDLAQITRIENTLGQETGYTIIVNANATTKGTYSFDIQSVTYNCVATISDEAKELNQGGVRIADNNITTPTDEMNISFTYNSPVKKIVAEGANGSIYAFDCWKLYYKDENGEFSTVEVPFENSGDNLLSIAFGSAPFNQEFKLVAHFTDENAILVSFGELNPNVKYIKFSGVEYDGTAIAVSPNHAKNLEIVTVKDYKLDVESLKDIIKVLYGENSIDTFITADPEVNVDGETIYKFSLNMGYMQNLSKKELNLSLVVEEDDSNKNDDLLWLWITIAGVGVLIIGLTIFLIVRRRRTYTGKGGKGGKGPAKIKEKKVSYKDFY